MALGLSFGCATAEDIFTEGRIENRCNDSVPVCGFQAGCVLGEDQFLAGRFPGGQRVIMRTESEQTRIILRFLLVDRVFPGTQIITRAYDTGCSDFFDARYEDRDLFDLSGDEGILEFRLDVEGRGDHMVEVFSDMGSGFLMTLTPEE
jgi:hypothetical protein